MVAFDLHANLSPRTAGLCDALFGFHFSPHIDMAETGARAARCLLAKLGGDADPRLALVKPPVVLPSIFTATALAPLQDIVAESLALTEKVPGILDASVFCGFAYADTPDLGFSVAVVADGDDALAQREAARLAGRVWAAREALLHEELVDDLDGGLAKAKLIAWGDPRPVVLLEHADRMNDSTWALRRLIAENADSQEGGLAVHCPYLWDPETAAATARELTPADLERDDLRREDVGQAASQVAAIPAVRSALLDFQRSFAARPPGGPNGPRGGAVLDGRDIGTVVCPDADMKFFLTASVEARATRRHKELLERGEQSIYARVLQDLRERDARDSGRATAPLKAADDAVRLDTSNMDADQAFEFAMAEIARRRDQERFQEN